MNIMINCGDLKLGGGVQVGDSICCQLDRFPQHKFWVVLSSYMEATAQRIRDRQLKGEIGNVQIVSHDIAKNLTTLVFGRDKILDKIVQENNIHRVLSVFGPSLWKPKCQHLVGFAMPHLVLTNSPFYKLLSRKGRFKRHILNLIMKHYFNYRSDYLWTENPMITSLVKKMLPKKEVHTITNYYNQIFDQPEKWHEYSLPPFNGKTFLCINAPYLHKNLSIAIEISKYLKKNHPDFQFRFVMSINRDDFPPMDPSLEENILFIGKVDISSVPSLYQQSDVMFQPSLLECFTATYPEAMRSKKPIVTTDQDFSRGLCGNAALYFSPLDAVSAADALYLVSTDHQLRNQLIIEGEKILINYDNYEERTNKLINLLEQTVK